MSDPEFAERVEVALPVPVEGTFSYSVPARWRGRALVGCRVAVRFGGRRLIGVVVELTRSGPEHSPDGSPPAAAGLFPAAPAPPPPPPAPRPARGGGGGANLDPPGFRLRPLDHVIDSEAVLSPSLLRIVGETAHEVFCPLGLALAAALPSGSTPKSTPAFALTERGRLALERRALSASLAPLLGAMRDAPQSARALHKVGATPAGLRRLVRSGLLRNHQLERGAAAQRRVTTAALQPDLDLPDCLAALRRAPKQAALLRHLAAGGELPVVELEAAVGASRSALAALARRGWVRLGSASRPSTSSRPERATAAPSPPPLLSPDQKRALAEIAPAVRQRRGETFLLHGVTGSGKTEVYLRAVQESLDGGRQALVLVPEISLTHQLRTRLEERFGDRVAVLHSGLGRGERVQEWRRLLRGGCPIAMGARSALFAPLDDLGVIVIDEEHDTAYKSEEGFRYNARDLAARRAAAAPCPLILGSATPALETRHAAESGAVRRLVLARRIGGRPLPAIEFVDLAAERALQPRGHKLVLSHALRGALNETLREQGQAILFLNRRGFSTSVFCFACGRAERCTHCDVSLVYHAPERQLRCHYCGFRSDPPAACRHCGAPDAALLGLGTQRVEEEVRRAFPDARIGRLDRDSSRRAGGSATLLAQFGGGHLDILIGTQMVALGHDVPGVRLVGVIAADLALHHPDFRAAERTFQLLTQVAGRAGRSDTPGRVIVQTFVPDHYAIRPVLRHDYEAFYREEMRYRKELGYPPFGQLLRVLVSGREGAACTALAERLAELARRSAREGAGEGGGEAPEVLGPAPAPIARLRDRERVQFLVKGEDRRHMAAIGRALARAGREAENADLRIAVDPHPITML